VSLRKQLEISTRNANRVAKLNELKEQIEKKEQFINRIEQLIEKFKIEIKNENNIAKNSKIKELKDIIGNKITYVVEILNLLGDQPVSFENKTLMFNFPYKLFNGSETENGQMAIRLITSIQQYYDKTLDNEVSKVPLWKDFKDYDKR